MNNNKDCRVGQLTNILYARASGQITSNLLHKQVGGYMRSDNLQLPCVQPPTSLCTTSNFFVYNLQLPHGRHGHHVRGGHGGHGDHVDHGSHGEHGGQERRGEERRAGQDRTGI